MLVWSWTPSTGNSPLGPSCKQCISAQGGWEASPRDIASGTLLILWMLLNPASVLSELFQASHFCFCWTHSERSISIHTWWQKFGGVANVVTGNIFHPGRGNDLGCDCLATTESLTYGPNPFVVHNANVFNSTSIKCIFLFCSFYNKWEKKNESP